MITVTVVTDDRRFKKVAKDLEFLSSEEFFKTIPMADFETKILAFMRGESPDDQSPTKLYKSGLGRYFKGAEAGFKESWRVARVTGQKSISYRLWNLLETVGGDQGVRKFSAIEYGTTASTFIAKRTYKFLSVENTWVTIKQGRTVQHAPMEGANVIGKTHEFIQNVLMPQIGEHINELIERRLRS